MKPIPKYIAILLVIIGFYACASTGSPDGGPYDEDPPKFIRAIPEPNATNNTRKKISIEFLPLDKTPTEYEPNLLSSETCGISFQRDSSGLIKVNFPLT